MIVRTNILANMCREMSRIAIPFEDVERRFLEDCLHMNGYQRNLGQLTGKLAELHTVARAEQLEKRYPGQIEIYRLREGLTQGIREYLPSQDGTPSVIVRDTHGIVMGEIDMVMMIGAMPVVVETHIAKYATCRRTSVAKILRPEIIERKKQQVAGLFGRKPEMVHVLLREQVEKNAYVPESRLAQYLDAGNYIVTFPWGRHQWRALAERFTFSLV